jgi:hypothetical protein
MMRIAQHFGKRIQMNPCYHATTLAECSAHGE